MSPDERRHGTSKSGWCMTTVRPGVKDCEHCRYPECPHECHKKDGDN